METSNILAADPHAIAPAYRLLTDEQCVALAQQGDQKASDHLAHKYRPLVTSTAARVCCSHIEEEDRRSCGYMGLLVAMRLYSTEGHGSFAGWAKRCVRHYILRGKKMSERGKDVAHNGALSLDANIPGADDFALADILQGSRFDDPLFQMLHQEHIKALVRQFLSISRQRTNQGLDGAAVGRLALEGYSNSEIAAELHTDAEKVKRVLGEIRHRVRLSPAGRDWSKHGLFSPEIIHR